jgi:Holliday junction resolvase RusA-like endonuclease
MPQPKPGAARRPPSACPTQSTPGEGKLYQDYDNAAGSIGDLLQDADVLENDDQIGEAHILKHRGVAKWKSTIHVTSIA